MTPPVDTVLSQSPVRCGAAALRATTGRQGDANSALLVERPCEIAMGRLHQKIWWIWNGIDVYSLQIQYQWL